MCIAQPAGPALRMWKVAPSVAGIIYSTLLRLSSALSPLSRRQPLSPSSPRGSCVAVAPAVSRPRLAAVVRGPLSPLLLARLSVSHLGRRCDWSHESFSWALGFRASGSSCLHCRLSVASFGTSVWGSQPYVANWWGRVAPPKKGCGHGWLHRWAAHLACP